MPTKKLQSETWGERRPNIVQRNMKVGKQDVGLAGQSLADALASADSVTEGVITEEERAAAEEDEGRSTQSNAPSPEQGELEPAKETAAVEEAPEPQATAEDDQPAELETSQREEPAPPAEEPAREEAAEDTVTLPRAEYDDLRRQQLMHADYTRKTQAIAEQKKELAVELESARAERAQYVALIKQVEDLLSDAEKEPDWATERGRLSAEQYADLRDAYAQRKRDREAAAAERKRVEAKAAEDKNKQTVAYVESEREKLFTIMPELRDQKVLVPWLERMRRTAKELGFTDQDFDGANDHRMFVMLNRAAKGSTATNRPETKKPPVSRPRSAGAGATPRVQTPQGVKDKARERMQKEQSVSAVGDYIASLDHI